MEPPLAARAVLLTGLAPVVPLAAPEVHRPAEQVADRPAEQEEQRRAVAAGAAVAA